ncbi:conserved protein of unknown function, might belong to Two component, sigma54 specific, transcriptional regulator, Fis family [Shewanella benthica]|uniref:DNA binding HTH domain-containing protein n=1 Tax=Shewanella benthica TaxID=43661 RepID=A0A330M8W8_9GAMM|nr:conserved protein of unknown function, might belong to Two component, sigma54 specific, transcriptional regulator, Fis family [Shewanella benthica]
MTFVCIGKLEVANGGTIFLDEFEKNCLKQAMNKHQGNRTKAAKFLELSHKAFLYRLEKYQRV